MDTSLVVNTAPSTRRMPKVNVASEVRDLLFRTVVVPLTKESIEVKLEEFLLGNRIVAPVRTLSVLDIRGSSNRTLRLFRTPRTEPLFDFSAMPLQTTLDGKQYLMLTGPDPSELFDELLKYYKH